MRMLLVSFSWKNVIVVVVCLTRCLASESEHCHAKAHISSTRRQTTRAKAAETTEASVWLAS